MAFLRGLSREGKSLNVVLSGFSVSVMHVLTSLRRQESEAGKVKITKSVQFDLQLFYKMKHVENNILSINFEEFEYNCFILKNTRQF